MPQQQMQPAMSSQPSGTPGAAGNFPQAYGTYPGMNAGTPTAYYPSGGGPTSQPQQGQQNPSFQASYQNYPYSQPSSEN